MQSYIGYSCDPEIRYAATSGGVGSAILKYLFDTEQIQTAISFEYDSAILQYVPKLIFSYVDYKPVGSIYHEIDLVDFIRKNISEIKGRFACFCLPCQALSIRRVSVRNGIDCFLMGLTCSSQQSIGATHYLLRRMNIPKHSVQHLQYRGNGWPSGIQIVLKDGTVHFMPNNNSLWMAIFHSRLFIMPRCFYCKNTLNVNSDISLADPWLKEYVRDEKCGLSLVLGFTQKGISILKCLVSEGYCQLNEIDNSVVKESQNQTIVRKLFYSDHKIKRNLLMKINRGVIYKKLFLSSPFLFFVYQKVKNVLEK